MGKFKGIVIHCSDSEFGNAQMIEDWHKERGFDDIGYHVVITNGQITKNEFQDFMDGSIEIGRDWSINGSHARGYNDYIGICLIGKKSFTSMQFEALLKVCKALIKEHDIKVVDVIGHYECEGTDKTCPNFDVSEIRRMLLAELEVFYG